MLPVFTTVPLTVTSPVPVMSFAFVPPVKSIAPVFSIPLTEETRFAFVVRLPLFTMLPWLIMPVLAVVPCSSRSPFPVILLELSPLVRISFPLLVISAETISASVVNVETTTIPDWAILPVLVTSPFMAMVPVPVMSFALAPPVNSTVPLLSIAAAVRADASLVSVPAFTILPVAVIVPTFTMLPVLFTSPAAVIAPALLNMPVLFTSFCAIEPVLLIFPLRLRSPAPVMSLAFTPPSRFSTPAFAMPAAVTRSEALLVSSPLTVIVFCSMLPLFTTVPLTVTSPVPVMSFAFVPPVKSIAPVFSIPLTEETRFAFVVRLPLFTMLPWLIMPVLAVVPCSSRSPFPVILLELSPLVRISFPLLVISAETISASVVNVETTTIPDWAILPVLVTSPFMAMVPVPVMSFALAPPVNSTVPLLSIAAAVRADASLVSVPAFTILPVAVIVPTFTTLPVLFTSPAAVIAPALLNTPVLFTSFCAIDPVLLIFPPRLRSPAPVISFAFTPPSRFSTPAFAMPFAIVRSEALLVSSPVTVRSFCVILPLFTTVPLTVTAPVPVIPEVFVPPIRSMAPSLAISRTCRWLAFATTVAEAISTLFWLIIYSPTVRTSVAISGVSPVITVRPVPPTTLPSRFWAPVTSRL